MTWISGVEFGWQGSFRRQGRTLQNFPKPPALELRQLLSATPRVLSIGLAPGSSNYGPKIDFLVTFSKDVSGVDAADFRSYGVGAVRASGFSVTPLSGSVYKVSALGVTGEGQLGIRLVDNNSIQDSDGRKLIGNFGSVADWQIPAGVLGDVTGDGRLDLVSLSSDRKRFEIRTGHSDFRFGLPDFEVSLPSALLGTSLNLLSYELSDVNGDERLDIASLITNNGVYTAAVFLGAGGGDFSAAIEAQYSYLMRPQWLDWEGDGDLDLVSAVSSNSVMLWDNNRLGAASNYLPDHVRVHGLADFNRDGLLDVLTQEPFPEYAVRLRQSDGSFTEVLRFDGRGGSVVLDGNGDGIMDIHTAPQYLRVGNGDGTFQPPVDLLIHSYRQTAFADLDRDGVVDNVQLIGNELVTQLADRSIRSKLTIDGDSPDLFLQDVDNDGVLDVVVQTEGSRARTLMLPGNGDGSFQMPALDWGGERNYDFNEDGLPDYLIDHKTGTPPGFSILLARSDGKFPTFSLLVSRVGDYEVADFNHDGHLDVLVGHADSFFPNQPFEDFVSLYLGNGDGTFRKAPQIQSALSQVRSVQALDINGDGFLDVIVAGKLLRGNGDGTFQPETTFGPEGDVRDLNGDGHWDVLGQFGSNINNGDGTFRPVPFSSGITTMDTIVHAAGDFDGDGRTEVILGSQLGRSPLTVYEYSASGGLVEIGPFNRVQNQLSQLTPLDYDGDGHLDLIEQTANRYYFYRGQGTGAFESGVPVSETVWGPVPIDPQITGDANQDGRIDLIRTLVNNTSVIVTGNGSYSGPLVEIVAAPVVIDDSQADFTTVGSWSRDRAGGVSGTQRTTNGSRRETRIARWTFTNLPDGVYEISATWMANRRNTPGATYRVPGDGSPLLSITVAQTVAPADLTENGVAWKTLGRVTVTGGQLVVELGNQTIRRVVADAIRIQKVSTITPPTAGALPVSVQLEAASPSPLESTLSSMEPLDLVIPARSDARRRRGRSMR